MKLDKNRMCIGIDLGTTNTSVAVSRVDVNGVIKLEDYEIRQRSVNNERKMDTLPSILFVKKDGKEVVGNEALDLKKNDISSQTDEIRYIENSKRYIGTTRSWEIEGKKYTAVDVASKILNHVKNFSNIKSIVDDSYVVITVPANFDTDQINNTLVAAEKAGFSNVQMLPEPKAAILSFLHDEKEKREKKLLNISSKKRILVIDIGGGTCDVCVEDVWIEKSGAYNFEHKAVGRDNLGGADFDKRIADYLVKNFCDSQLSNADVSRLIDIGQTFKERLSDRIEYLIDDDYDGDQAGLYTSSNWLNKIMDADNVQLSRFIGGKDITFEMDVKSLYDSIIPLINDDNKGISSNKDERELNKNMEGLINDTLRDNCISLDSIDVIFLTGGMSKCFIMKAALYELYKKPIICPNKPFLAVSRGASLMNKYDNEDIVSNDIMPRSIMIETNSGYFKKLVSAGERVPVTRKVDEIFKTTSRTGVIIRLFEGKDEFDNQLRKLNTVYTFRFASPQPLNREFQIEYTVDRTKRIKFTIHFLDDGTSFNIDAKVADIKGGN